MEVILDLDAMSAADGEEWVFKGVDCLPKQYRHCLVELSSGGGDAVTIREFDMQAKAFVENGFQLPAAKTRVTWMDRDTLLVATDFGPGTLTESGYPRVIKRWKRGTTLDEARTVHQAKPRLGGSPKPKVSYRWGEYRCGHRISDLLEFFLLLAD